MSDNDNDIRTVLAEADAKCALDGEDFRDMLVSSFRGKLKWMSIVAWVYMLLFTGVSVFAAVRFFGAGDTREMIMYATIFIVSMTIIMVIKLWYWLLMNRNAVKREIKRLELRIMEQAQK